jgi:hypothetical protein
MSQSNIIVTVDPAWPPVSGADLRNWNNALASIEFAPTRLISLGALRAPETEVKGIQLLSLSQAHAGEIYRRPPNGSAIDISIPPGAIENLRFIYSSLVQPTQSSKRVFSIICSANSGR